MAILPEVILGLPATTWFTVVLPASLTLYWALWIGYTRTLHPLASVPGPFWPSVTRLWYMYRIYMGDMEVVQRRLHEQYGPLVRIAPNEVSTAEPSSIPKIYRNQRPLLKTDFYPVWGGSTISKQPDTFTVIDERVHSNYRRIVNPVYTLSNVLKTEEHIDTCSKLFVQRLGEHADQAKAIDLGEWLQMCVAFSLVTHRSNMSQVFFRCHWRDLLRKDVWFHGEE